MTALWVLNPNSTQAMTDAVLVQVRALLPPGSTVAGITLANGPAVIDSRASYAAAAAQVAGQTIADGAVLLACFGDPGLEALRARRSPQPVVGLAESAVAAAVAARQRFAIVTAGAAWVDMLRERVADFGATAWLTDVHALPFNGLQLAHDPEACRAPLAAVVRAAEQGGAEAIVLGGAAFAGLRGLVQTRLVVIDPVAVATRALQAALAAQ